MACYENESFQRFELIAHLHGWVATIIDAFVDFENYLDEDLCIDGNELTSDNRRHPEIGPN